MPAYTEIASNTSGSTPKELFQDVLEELEKQVPSLYLVFVVLVTFSFCHSSLGGQTFLGLRVFWLNFPVFNLFPSQAYWFIDWKEKLELWCGGKVVNELSRVGKMSWLCSWFSELMTLGHPILSFIAVLFYTSCVDGKWCILTDCYY